MPVESAADLAAMYADFGVSASVTLSAAGNAVVQVRAILDLPSGTIAAGQAGTARLRVPAAAFAARPRRPDAVTVGALSYRVERVETDISGAELLIDLARA